MSSANFQATGNINPSVFVKIDTSNDNSVVQCVGSDQAIGVSQEFSKLAPIPGAASLAAASGDNVRVYGLGAICLLTAGSAGYTRGDKLKPDANGNAITASSNDLFGAIALESAVAAALGRVQVVLGKV